MYLNASLLGFGRAQRTSLFPEIVEFAEIGDFLQEPLRTYSSGMVMRLAFSVAVNVDPDILVIESMRSWEPGTPHFRQNVSSASPLSDAPAKLSYVFRTPRTPLMEICDTAIWLDHGEMMMQGPVEQVWQAYTGGSAVSA